MQFEQNSKQIRVVQSGACVLRAQATWIYVQEEGFERFNDCYRNAAQAYLTWAEHKQGKLLREQYAAQKSDRMFGFRPMTCRMEVRAVWQHERFVSVVIDSVRDSGVRGEYPICHRSADVWDMVRGVILSPKVFLSSMPELRGMRVGGKRPEGLWVDESGVVLYHNAGADGYAEFHTGIEVAFVPRRGSAEREYVPTLVPNSTKGR